MKTPRRHVHAFLYFIFTMQQFYADRTSIGTWLHKITQVCHHRTAVAATRVVFACTVRRVALLWSFRCRTETQRERISLKVSWTISEHSSFNNRSERVGWFILFGIFVQNCYKKPATILRRHFLPPTTKQSTKHLCNTVMMTARGARSMLYWRLCMRYINLRIRT